MSKICILGDSITAGASDPQRFGWAQRLKLDFEANILHNVFIFGVDGATSTYLCKHITHVVRKSSPEYIIIAIGINDSLYTQTTLLNEVPLPRFYQNMNLLVNESKKYTSKIVLVGLTNIDETKVQPIPWLKTKSYSNDHIFQYDKTLQRIAKEHNIYFLTLFNTLSTEEMADGLHPTSNGHQKLYKLIKRFLLENKII